MPALDSASGAQPPGARMPPLPWLYRARKWQLILGAAGIGVVVFAAEHVLEFAMGVAGLPPEHLIIQAHVATGVLAGIASYALIRYALHRRRAILDRVQLPAEMNHHIRNAIEQIKLSAYGNRDRQAVCVINDAVSRIEWTLTEVLGAAKDE